MPVPELVINHQVIKKLLTGDREGMLLGMVPAGKAMGSTPILAYPCYT